MDFVFARKKFKMNKLVLFIFCTIIAFGLNNLIVFNVHASSNFDNDPEWITFKKQFNKDYDCADEEN